jgi:hypothetical protein
MRVERLRSALAYEFERITTQVRLVGAGADGLGEDVSVFREDGTALHETRMLVLIRTQVSRVRPIRVAEVATSEAQPPVGWPVIDCDQLGDARLHECRARMARRRRLIRRPANFESGSAAVAPVGPALRADSAHSADKAARGETDAAGASRRRNRASTRAAAAPTALSLPQPDNRSHAGGLGQRRRSRAARATPGERAIWAGGCSRASRGRC